MLGQHHHRAQPLADARGDRLAEHPEARDAMCRSASSAWPKPQQVLRARLTYAGTKLRLQHRARRLLVVADGQRRRQHGAADARRAGRPGVEGRHAALAVGFIGAPAARRLAHHHRQPVGRRWRWRSSRRSSRARRSPASRAPAWARAGRGGLEQVAAHRAADAAGAPHQAIAFGAPARRQPAQQHDAPALAGRRQRHARRHAAGHAASRGSRCSRSPRSRSRRRSRAGYA